VDPQDPLGRHRIRQDPLHHPRRQVTLEAAAGPALEDSRLLRVDRAGVQELLERDPDLLERFAQLVNSRRRELESLGHEEQQREASNLLEAMRNLFFALGGG
jgi:hypothetical protein